MKEILFATHNRNKAREVAALLGDGYRVVTLDEKGIDKETEEDGETLKDNALKKAREAHEASGIACFADDTGLIVDSLGGRPGVMTARYAGEACDPDANIRKLLGEMEGKADRRARFKTIVALVEGDGKEHIFEGVCEGQITAVRQGNGGFGYDPVFAPEGYEGKTFAELSMEEKNKISHRGRAMRALIEWLRERAEK
ncbi:MAG: RdgB/HAM1 family non-canonical purine NTP pyrophosphatase [Bacteroidales bacterium]|nr:RdgB/HAM1 family non-canonical purine NTP pyrophosphatase [Bacteroidales bacterium]